MSRNDALGDVRREFVQMTKLKHMLLKIGLPYSAMDNIFRLV